MQWPQGANAHEFVDNKRPEDPGSPSGKEEVANRIEGLGRIRPSCVRTQGFESRGAHSFYPP